MTARLWFVPLLLLAGAAPLAASDAKEPYRLVIVLDVAKNRLLTPIFREQVAREVGDALQSALGELARVEVTDTHPLLDDVRKLGLERGLDGAAVRGAAKYHFLQIDFAGGHYELAARQFDGSLGLPGPVVRRDRTRDRALVARTAALLIERDLGLVGTVESEPDAGGLVRVGLKGGGLGVPLARWVKKGDVFALAQPGGRGPGQAIPWAYVVAEGPPADGVFTGRLVRRFQLGRATDLRCVKLGTTAAPLRLRLVQEQPGGRRVPLEAPVQLQVRRLGFTGEDTSRLQINADGTRDVDTAGLAEKGRFQDIAYVVVLSGETPRARFPVAILDDRPVVVPLPAVSEDGTLLAYRFTALRRAVADSNLVQAELVRQINALSGKPEQRKAAVAKVRAALARSREDHERLSAERGAVLAELAKLPEKDRPSLTAIDDRLRELRAGEADLLAHVELLEKIEKEENDPKRRKWLEDIERAKLLEKDAELGQAIAVYDQVKKDGFVSAGLDAHVAGLKKLWEPKDDKQRAARAFIDTAWTAIPTAQLKDRLKEAESALAELQRTGDVIYARRFLRGTQAVGQRLEKEADTLKPELNIDDQKPAQAIKDALPGLEKLDAALRALVEKARTP